MKQLITLSIVLLAVGLLYTGCDSTTSSGGPTTRRSRRPIRRR